jgi:hypothetical protein
MKELAGLAGKMLEGRRHHERSAMNPGNAAMHPQSAQAFARSDCGPQSCNRGRLVELTAVS